MTRDLAPRRFALRADRSRDASLRLAVEETRPRRDEQGDRLVRVALLGGDPLRAVTERVLTALRRCGHRGGAIERAEEAPLALPEEEAVRLALLFLAVQPMRREDRVQAVARAVFAMGAEELYYWFGRCSSTRGGARAKRALRVLLSDE